MDNWLTSSLFIFSYPSLPYSWYHMTRSESRAADAISATRVSRSGCRCSAASVRSASDPTPVTTTILVWPRGSSSSTSTAPPDRRAATGKACYEISRYKYVYLLYLCVYLQPSTFFDTVLLYMLVQSNKLLVLGCLHVSCTKTYFLPVYIYHYFAPRA